MAKSGRLIVFEGGEGSGKTTQARLLAERLGALLTREPGGTSLGEAIRGLCLEFQGEQPIDPHAELLLMLAARAQHVREVIAPALAQGRDVVCDRYSGSTIAYQGFGRGLPLEMVRSLCVTAEQGVVATVSVLLDVSAAEGLSRVGTTPDRIESESNGFHERVVEGFRTLSREEPERWIVVDRVGSKEAVATAVNAALEEFFARTTEAVT